MGWGYENSLDVQGVGYENVLDVDGGGRYENFVDVDLQTNILNLNISVSRGVRTSNFANIMWENITKSYGKGAKNRKTFL